MADDATLRRLVAGIARGEADRRAELYDLTSPKLYGLIVRIRRDRALAEDVLQDVFLRIWQAAAPIGRKPGRPGPG
ncbi:RNA polymerase sigma-70 factor, ECF subfamily [Methylobacterium phyllostachyos]|uniref:RNA polymerase sigma-70 factor, ECF subfamily n=1 Tax=Methylobacterium phyllostachyos TaxID=582672 RepID=A0A1H0C3J8_9HYPH|nr:sigma factor [Methylobacterium phyllostachyos]SDN52471.1 RNA polymerase sigma-70 factor, ECF subfamily [Methylobacterium phyllostachyos]